MAIEDIPSQGWMWAVVVALVLAQAYNTICTVRNNMREEKKRHAQPTKTIEEKVAEHGKMLDNDKRRLDEHDAKLADMKQGQMVICAGVQVLIEHTLHNGNRDEMEQVSREIDKWLRTRP